MLVFTFLGNSMEACQVYDILRMKAVCLTGWFVFNITLRH